MVFYVKKETAPRVLRVVNWRAFYYFSTTFDGRDVFCNVLPQYAINEDMNVNVIAGH
jgi:hypothetical protein